MADSVPQTARHVLRGLHGKRFRCSAVVERFGTKSAYRGPPIRTLLLRDVSDPKTGTILTDHLWFTAGKWSDGLQPGDKIEFDARVGEYEKGYKGRRDDVWDAPICTDYRLERPTRVVKVMAELQSPSQFRLGETSGIL